MFRKLSVQVLRGLPHGRVVRNGVKMDANRFISTTPLKCFYDDETSNIPHSHRLPVIMESDVIWPSIPNVFRNFVQTNFLIRPFFDPRFSQRSFLEGAKAAVSKVSTLFAEGKMDELEALVSEETITTLKKKYFTLNCDQKRLIKTQPSDIYLSFIYQIGILMGEDPGDRSVEILVVCHTLKNYLDASKNGVSIDTLKKREEDLVFTNYRFIRNYSKGVEDEWTVNLINHFHPKDGGHFVP